jgi:iron complex transport system ATP-binding protein
VTAILSGHDVTVRIGAKLLVDRISLSFNPAETVAIVGPNGAGKTTLLRALAGELRAGAGSVLLKGRAINDYGPRELARHRAVLSQNISVAFPFTVAETVRMGASNRSSRAVDALVDAALAEVALSDFANRVITTLSGGEQQRAHFARVLVQLACSDAADGPGILLLDEPTASLDLKHQIELLMLARRRTAQGITVIAVLHDLNLATLFAERIVVLNGGRIECDGTPTETVTSEIVERVFGIAAPVGCTPPKGVPFILPQATTW